MGFHGISLVRSEPVFHTHRYDVFMILFDQQCVQWSLWLSWLCGAAAVLHTRSLKLFWLERTKGQVSCLSPQADVAAQGGRLDCGKGVKPKSGSWGEIQTPCHPLLCQGTWLFHTQNTLVSVIKAIGRTHVNNFLIANLIRFLFITLHSPWNVIIHWQNLELGGFL